MPEIIFPTKDFKANKDHKCNYCNGIIPKGSVYQKSTLKYDGDIYTWKNHCECSDIAMKLHMFDDADEGVTSDMFYEKVNDEYMRIMQETQTELYESKDFVYPKFKEQLSFVIEHHAISHTKD